MKFIRVHSLGALFFILSSPLLYAQSSISLSTGIAVDVNNKALSIFDVPVSLEWKPFKTKGDHVFLEFDGDIPVGGGKTVTAYTLNEALPPQVKLRENIRSSLFTASIGFSIRIFTTKAHNSFYIHLLPVGLCIQDLKIGYKNYDKTNYEVLDPDIGLHREGFVSSFSLVYRFYKKDAMMLRLHLQSPLFAGRGDYPLSYRYSAPLELTYGYALHYNNKRK